MRSRCSICLSFMTLLLSCKLPRSALSRLAGTKQSVEPEAPGAGITPVVAQMFRRVVAAQREVEGAALDIKQPLRRQSIGEVVDALVASGAGDGDLNTL